MRITSLQNDRVKAIRALDMRKARRETGLFVAEGAALLITARDNGWVPRTLVIGPDAEAMPVAQELAAWARGAGAECLEVSAAVLEKLASKENPQSLIGVFEQRWTAVPEPAARAAAHASGDGKAATGSAPTSNFAKGATGTARADRGTARSDKSSRISAKGGDVWLALEEIRDPGNLGTIIRTADASGAAGVVLAGQTCDPFSHEAVRASMGSIFAVPVGRIERAELVALAKRWPGSVVGTHLSGREDYRAARYEAPVLLVMGNEGAGLSSEMTAACRQLVRIPMVGRLDSLNLAVATALMLYEIRREHL